jgi:hypothetical protein
MSYEDEDTCLGAGISYKGAETQFEISNPPCTAPAFCFSLPPLPPPTRCPPPSKRAAK